MVFAHRRLPTGKKTKNPPCPLCLRGEQALPKIPHRNYELEYLVASELLIVDSPASMAVTAADIFAKTAKDCVGRKGRFAVAISGGSTPRATHRLLAEQPYRSEIPWTAVHIFWVDERCVPQDSKASNYGVAKKDLVDRVPILPQQVHPMTGDTSPEQAAIAYQKKLKAFFRADKGGLPIFDLIFLGVGKDGHTASMFPGQQALDEKENWVVAVKGGDPDVSRITMTYPVLNRASQVVLFVSGKQKAAVVKAVLEDKHTDLPAQRIQPANGKLTWLLDHDAASLLSN